ncbi:hypothetical protein ZWY2020_009443 [Hordeum vulgare]|nr:hypothetical protein ZWY2020_009443 [Hordeum vulgare]
MEVPYWNRNIPAHISTLSDILLSPGDDLEDVRKDARRDTSLGDRVKRLVLHRWEQYKDVNDKLCECVELTEEYQANEQNIEEPSTMIKLKARVTEEPIEEQSTMIKFTTLRMHKWVAERSIDDD